MKTIYELRTLADAEGRTTRVVGYFENRGDAEAVCSTTAYGWGLWGQDLEVVVKPVEVYADLMDFVVNTRDDISFQTAKEILGESAATPVMRERLLKKLTDEERRILGVDLPR